MKYYSLLIVILLSSLSTAISLAQVDSCFCPGLEPGDLQLERCPSETREMCSDHSCSFVKPSGLAVTSACGSNIVEFCGCSTPEIAGRYYVYNRCPTAVRKDRGEQCGNFKCDIIIEVEPGVDLPISIPCSGS